MTMVFDVGVLLVSANAEASVAFDFFAELTEVDFFYLRLAVIEC
jgi:hypothetical protein